MNHAPQLTTAATNDPVGALVLAAGSGLVGSDEAFTRVVRMILEWEDTRSGKLEKLAFIVMSEGISLDAALARIDRPNTPGEPRPVIGVGSTAGLASQRRVRQMEVAIQHDRLSRASELAQIEAIALHYVANFNNARDILEIVKLGSYSVPLDENASACVRILAEQLRNNHAHDLGIELSWPNAGDEARPGSGPKPKE